MNALTGLPDAILSVAMSYLHSEGGEMRVRDRESLHALVVHLGTDFPRLQELLELPSAPGSVLVRRAAQASRMPATSVWG